jgi:hypothetical protein
MQHNLNPGYRASIWRPMGCRSLDTIIENCRSTWLDDSPHNQYLTCPQRLQPLGSQLGSLRNL